jgi:hypothetical protein
MGNGNGEARQRGVMPGSEPSETAQFYGAALARLHEARVPFMVGGGYALRFFTGIERWTKDLDLFVRPSDAATVLEVLAPIGTQAEMLFPHWLGKVYGPDAFIDIVFSSGNAVAVVDDDWFRYGPKGSMLGISVRYCPAEETIWSKAFVAERERYDGADIAHLIRLCGDTLDWARLLQRFGEHWRVLLSHLVLYGYIFPAERDRVPAWVLTELGQRLSADLATEAPTTRLCRGTLLSREQYLPDITQDRYLDARLVPEGRMTSAEIAIWTDAISEDGWWPEEERHHEHRRRR